MTVAPKRHLIVAEPWISAILAGAKTWEMRSRRTNVRGPVGLIRKGSGLIVATTSIEDSPGRLDEEAFRAAFGRHAIPPDRQDAAIAGGWLWPWVLGPASVLPEPVPYAHPRGAVVWVRTP